MEQFTLTAEIITLDDGNYNIMIHPNDAIHNYIHAYKFVESGSLNQTLIDNFIIEQTSLLFNNLQTNHPEIASNYYL
ncbi:hypothetical protein UFOVP200_21 [uncultured Caudovirales phage]|uniref:Uncharacterized protein n=1 Tax=uncultured Caudovirales phage TaxID=2100421 RepID=A0A6J7WL48_9CAUD|nr:hypothetical protein UFOVP200_21 [uncultured Caudovirales phage]